MTWDNGDRTVLVNPNLRGITLGWYLQSIAQDELFAAIEGAAFHTRVILDRMAAHGVHIQRVINASGIAQKDTVRRRAFNGLCMAIVRARENLMNCVCKPRRPGWTRRLSSSTPVLRVIDP
jgi:ribulose kinase